ncbi:MAG: hypothetical protein AB7G93_03510 [Bdellovibrionales bacterium]
MNLANLLSLFFFIEVGIRLIGNGGGLAEMQTMGLLNRMDRLVEPCIQRPELCHLSQNEHEFLRATLAEWKLGKQAKLGFFDPTDPDEDYRYRVDDSEYLAISSHLIYDDLKAPKAISDLTQIAFVGWLLRPAAQDLLDRFGMDKPILISLGAKIFEHFVAEDEVLVRNESDQLHAIQLRNRSGEAVEAFLALERAEVSHDLSSILRAALGCAEPHLLTVSNLYAENESIVGEVGWSCAGERKTATFAMTVPHATEKSLDLSQIVVRVSRARPLPLPSFSCRLGLTPVEVSPR